MKSEGLLGMSGTGASQNGFRFTPLEELLPHPGGSGKHGIHVGYVQHCHHRGGWDNKVAGASRGSSTKDLLVDTRCVMGCQA